jgi:hypothetical protein
MRFRAASVAQRTCRRDSSETVARKQEPSGIPPVYPADLHPRHGAAASDPQHWLSKRNIKSRPGGDLPPLNRTAQRTPQADGISRGPGDEAPAIEIRRGVPLQDSLASVAKGALSPPGHPDPQTHRLISNWQRFFRTDGFGHKLIEIFWFQVPSMNITGNTDHGHAIKKRPLQFRQNSCGTVCSESSTASGNTRTVTATSRCSRRHSLDTW